MDTTTAGSARTRRTQRTQRAAQVDAGRATGSFYVNFDAGDGWPEQLADVVSGGDAAARSNIAPLDALGASAWTEGDVQHGLLRLTTD